MISILLSWFLIPVTLTIAVHLEDLEQSDSAEAKTYPTQRQPCQNEQQQPANGGATFVYFRFCKIILTHHFICRAIAFKG